jgi:hypothetical protein
MVLRQLLAELVKQGMFDDKDNIPASAPRLMPSDDEENNIELVNTNSKQCNDING